MVETTSQKIPVAIVRIPDFLLGVVFYEQNFPNNICNGCE